MLNVFNWYYSCVNEEKLMCYMVIYDLMEMICNINEWYGVMVWVMVFYLMFVFYLFFVFKWMEVWGEVIECIF